jgi:hypothetical protein
MYAAGLTRAKNSAGGVARAVCDFGVAVLAFYLVGAAIVSQQHNRVFAMSFAHWFDAGLGTGVLYFLLHAVVATGLCSGRPASGPGSRPCWPCRRPWPGWSSRCSGSGRTSGGWPGST